MKVTSRRRLGQRKAGITVDRYTDLNVRDSLTVIEDVDVLCLIRPSYAYKMDDVG